MAQLPVQHHCKDCGLFFDSSKSLDVHVQYHKENLLSKWGNSSGDESNNNNVKPSKPPRMTAVPAESGDSILDRFSPSFNFPINRSTTPATYNYPPTDMRPPSVGQDFTPNSDTNFILGTGSGFPQRVQLGSSSTSPRPMTLQQMTPFRYHPYQQAVYTQQDHRNGGGNSSSPCLVNNSQATLQCEKCGYVSDSPAGLLNHIQNSHSPPPGNTYSFTPDYITHPEPKSEPQAEILDLDSHKVHVYQPPQGQESSESSQLDPGLVPWMSGVQEKKLYHTGQINGSDMPPLGFLNVSPTTLNSPQTPPHLQSFHYEHHIGSPSHLPPQLASSQMPILSSKQIQSANNKSSGNASWKSNEARRPKTYNCTACNKWFTSSGHLKRHYNTTLHKNAVKQSGIPDPANLPVSNHHHPPKDPAPPYRDSPPIPQIEDNPLMTVKIEEANFVERLQSHMPANGSNFLSSPPNSMAGPSELTGGLLLHTTRSQPNLDEMRLAQHTPIPPTQHQQMLLPFQELMPNTYPQDMTIYPNCQPPRVTSTQRTVTSSTTGNSDVVEQNADMQQIWGENGELKSQLIALTTPVHYENSLPGFSYFASNCNIFVTPQSNVGGLSPVPATLDSYHMSHSPIRDCQIGSAQALETETFNTPGESNTVSSPIRSKFEEYPSPDKALPSYTEDDMEISIPLEHVKMDENIVSRIITETSASAQIKCVDCDKSFNKACYLTQHNKSFHTGERPYKCEKCGKRFEIESQRREHLSKHAGEKPYKCEMCPKQFNHKTDLRRHMCLHSGDKPFSCRICGKGFIRKDHMVKHCETHKKKPTFATQVRTMISHKQVDMKRNKEDIHTFSVPVHINR